ncbi:peptidase M23 [Chlorella sorokiniana]|uniref:Peptidase M23 n=1 Tax=Chlorella sorokiniana TaxID=3076 RepID=A0A2P6U3F1_CHLSO|nr:peptidase M23 [Chlorella sorokiniana]|eukprot:PRW60840.1 peptidase M23 [Chlorella sorokiniana]
MLFLVAIGGAVVLEVHRALQHNGNADVQELRKKEAELRRQLQDIQRDLKAAQQQRELTESEAAQLAAINQRLSAENASLAATADSLKAENQDLAARSASLLEQQAALEAAAEGLKLENSALIQQFDRLKLRFEAESASFQEQLSELKEAVGGALSRFTQGEIDADQLVAFLSSMGVELRGRREDLASLPDQLNSARSTEERLKLLDRVEVEVSEGWLQQMRLATAEPERAARLLMAGAAARGSGSGSSGSMLLEGPAAAAAGASASAPFSPPKLPTPRRGLPAAQMPAVKVPPLKLPSAASGGAPAATAAVPVALDENAATNAVAVAAAAGGKKKGAMRFLPGAKKAPKKAAAPLSSQPQLALEVPLGSGRGAGSGLPRLPFDAANDDMDAPGGRSLVAL